MTWIIGKTELALVQDIEDIEFIVFDKSQGLRAYRTLAAQLKTRRFDVLLHMQMSLRASLIAMLIKSPIKLGFDRKRAKDLQWLFTNHKIRYQPRQHVIDSFFGFSEALGIGQHEYRWDIPIADADRASVNEMVKTQQPILTISPCSSMAYRNWSVRGYADVADYAISKYNLCVVLSGGPSQIEAQYGREIAARMQHSVINLIGITTLKQLMALLDKSSVVIAPDAGPAHLANAVATPVIGLYATTNPDRARPYHSQRYVVNKYPQAVQDKYAKPVEQLPWGIRVRDPGTMDRISSAEVKAMLDAAMLEYTGT